jgi:hypothetical protein
MKRYHQELIRTADRIMTAHREDLLGAADQILTECEKLIPGGASCPGHAAGGCPNEVCVRKTFVAEIAGSILVDDLQERLVADSDLCRRIGRGEDVAGAPHLCYAVKRIRDLFGSLIEKMLASSPLGMLLAMAMSGGRKGGF